MGDNRGVSRTGGSMDNDVRLTLAVTGASGFVGSHLVLRLRRDGLGVVAFHQGDRASARRYAARSRAIDPRAAMLRALDRDLR